MNPTNPFEGVGIIGSLILFLIVSTIIIFATGYMVGGPEIGQKWSGKFLSWLLISIRKCLAWLLRFTADAIAPAKKKKKGS